MAEALDPQQSLGLGLKWPNDVWVGTPQAPRKLAGMLIETVWVEGDNSDSTDSRTWGWIMPNEIVGRVLFRYRKGK
jgi:hypothetical protein